jgi:hypothetical protein
MGTGFANRRGSHRLVRQSRPQGSAKLQRQNEVHSGGFWRPCCRLDQPPDIDSWLGTHDRTAATKNRYENVFGKTFKIALTDGKITGNPVRLVEQRAENNSRIRFLSDDCGEAAA